MTYSKTAWVNSGAPAINATNLNKIEQGIFDADAGIAAINTELGTNPSGGSATVAARFDALDSTIAGMGGTGDDGCVYLNDFAGATADDKLTAALSYCAAQTYKPTLVMPAGLTTLSTARTLFTGFKMRGAGGGASVEQPRGGNPFATKLQINTSGTWLSTPASAVYGCYIGNIAFQGTSAGQWMGETGGTLWTSVIENVGFAEWGYVIGRPNTAMPLTSCKFMGFWNVNNSFNTAISVRGSDCDLWTEGMLIDSPTGYMGATSGHFHLRLESLSKTNIGPIYMTAEGMSGIYVVSTYSANQGAIIFNGGGRVEGRNAGAPTLGAGIVIDGNVGVTLRDQWVAFGMSSPGTSGHAFTHGGLIHIRSNSGYRPKVIIDGLTTMRATGVDETTPTVYNNGGNVRITNTVGWGTWTNPPKVTNVTAAGGTIDYDNSVTYATA